MFTRRSIPASRFSKRSWGLGLTLASLVLTATVFAADSRSRGKVGEPSPDNATVEMFAAIDKGDIAVQLSFKDMTQCRVRIENKTDKAMNIKLPEAFAGVPVLAQRQGGAGRNAGGSGTGGRSGGGNQSMGGGMGGMGMGGMGMGMGMMNVPPERVGQLNVTTVCLEHGKHEPRPDIPYEIKPMESFTTKAGVRELCQMLGNGQIDQRAAQAAAWHLNNDMSWQDLAAKRIRHATGTTEPYFSPQEIQAGMQIALGAVRLAEERQRQNSDTNASAASTTSTPSEK
jgi:hypothetical protein